MGRHSLSFDEVHDILARSDQSLTARAYSLAFTPLYGRWSDIFGRKFMLLSTLVVFSIFSLACALARTMIQVRLTPRGHAFRD